MCSDMKHGEMTLVRLKRRADFLRVARTGRRHGTAGLVLQTAPRHGRTIDRSEGALGIAGIGGIGFTASKKVGNAVARNRAKRRLRALAADVMPARAAPNHDYVLIGRTATLQRPYAKLRYDLLKALGKTGGLTRS